MSDRRELYQSASGDTWYLGREPTNGRAFVIHQPCGPSGGATKPCRTGRLPKRWDWKAGAASFAPIDRNACGHSALCRPYEALVAFRGIWFFERSFRNVLRIRLSNFLSRQRLAKIVKPLFLRIRRDDVDFGWRRRWNIIVMRNRHKLESIKETTDALC